jgi:acetyltransferase-like isoleucine patch superfamily enzyme
MLDLIRQFRYGNGLDLCLVNGNVRLGKKVRATLSIIDGDITIGDGAMISPLCVIVSNCHRTNKSMPVRIGERVWVGSHCTITQGCKIGKDAVIGANSVLTRGTVVGDGELWAGVPARRKR